MQAVLGFVAPDASMRILEEDSSVKAVVYAAAGVQLATARNSRKATIGRELVDLWWLESERVVAEEWGSFRWPGPSA